MKNHFQKINLIFLFAVVIYIPFQGLLQNFMEFRTRLSSGGIFWLAHWYEPVLLSLFVLGLFSHFIQRQKFSNGQILSLTLLILGFFSIFLLSSSIGRGIEGFRFTLLGLMFYLLASEINFKTEAVKNAVNVYLFLSCFIALWALLERVFPYYYWSQWHIIGPETIFGYGWHNVAFLKQSASIIGGPNQLATYLMPAFFISIVRAAKFWGTKDKKNSVVYLTLTILVNLVILLTFSRSAFIGFALVLLSTPFFFVGNKLIRNYIIAMLAFILVALIIVFFAKENALELITHGRSQSEHSVAIKSSLSEIYSRLRQPVALLFGAGLGSAGPLVLKYRNGIISESWYLQLILELGLISVFLWLGFIYVISKILLKLKEFGLFFGLISVSIAAIFLHTFADNPSLAYTLFILIGLKINLTDR